MEIIVRLFLEMLILITCKTKVAISMVDKDQYRVLLGLGDPWISPYKAICLTAYTAMLTTS